MSARAMAWAWDIIRSGIFENRHAAKLVLLRLADRADPEGKCWPGHQRTALDLCVSKTIVKESIRLLISYELLHSESRKSEDGDFATNLYFLHLSFAISPRGGAPEGGAASAPPGAASAPGVGRPPPQGGAAAAPESKRESNNGSSSTRDARVPAPASAGAAANSSEATEKANENKALRIVHGVNCWTPDDMAVALALVELNGSDAVLAAAKNLQNQGIAPLPGRVAQDLTRRASAAAAAEAAARAAARCEQIERASRARVDRELAEMMALQAAETSQERDS